MRILLDYRPALRERTGVGEFAHELARGLNRLSSRSDELAIFTTSWKDRPSKSLASELPGVRVVDWRLPVRGLTWAWNHLGWPPVEWLAGPADVVHAQSPLLIPTARAAQLITIHDLDFLMHPERTEAEMQRDFPRLAADHARQADHIIVSSRYAAGEVANRLNVSAAKISICAPGASAWVADVAQSRAAGHGGSLILFVGTLEPRKNIGGLLDAYAILRSRRAKVPPLILAGRARASVKHHLDRISSAPLSGHVQDVGYVSEDRKQQLYRDACMLVLPSFEEGFGLPVLDAMASGVPVVVSNRGSLPEVAGAAASPVEPNDADAIATAMEQLLDSNVAAAAAERGFARARSYSWDKCARAAHDAYRAAIAARAARQG